MLTFTADPNVRYATRLRDLERVACSVLPYLYRHVSLYVSALWKYSPPVVNVGNPGLVHIRTLRIIDGQFVEAFDSENHLPNLLELLGLLPKNGLLAFESVAVLHGPSEA